MLEQISYCRAHKLRFVLYNLMISGGTTSLQTYIFPEGCHQCQVNFCLVRCLFLSMLDLGGFSQQQLSCTNEDIGLKQELSPTMVFKIPGEKLSLQSRCNCRRTRRIFELSSWSRRLPVPRAAAGIAGGTMAWCFSGASVMGLAAPWHLRRGRTEWQKAISWASDLQKQMCFMPCL